MFKYSVYKILLSVFVLFGISLDAKEPTMAILKNIFSNDTQKFNIGNTRFYCTPYGVVGIDQLYASSSDGSPCRTSIEKFYKKNPLLKYYTDSVLDEEQTYHLEFKNGLCILYAKGEMTLSELLLKNGLAILKQKFKDEEFAYSFTKAYNKAKSEKIGIYGGSVMTDCASEVLKASN